MTRIPDECDAETRALLEWVAEADPPPLHGMSALEARAEYDERRVRSELSPVPVARVEDRAIAGPASPIPLRIYAPREGEGLPVLVYYHGGGFVIGDLDSHDSICRRIAVAADCLVVSVAYRLAPEAPYPAAVEDSLAAFDWCAAHVAEVGGDAARLAVGGDSAGGGLAAYVAQQRRDQIDCQILIYPYMDPNADTGTRQSCADVFPIDKPTIDWFNAQYLPDEARRGEVGAAPGLVDDVAGLPGALVLTASLDPLCDEAKVYADRIAAAGVPMTYHCDPGTIHGYLGMGQFLPHAERAIEKIGASLREAFG
ncbi:MAG: alpha/beta hydrolase [Alphaproteobacteria bacterium]|jgi:acetyl esterase|nr:alpha/beta hydrolase [Alphaproteobacteria bacterium]